jgi:hypothetical protein
MGWCGDTPAASQDRVHHTPQRQAPIFSPDCQTYQHHSVCFNHINYVVKNFDNGVINENGVITQLPAT